MAQIGISISTFAALTNARIADIYYNILAEEMPKYGVGTQQEVCAFLAELTSEGLSKPSENLYYTAERLHEVFSVLFPTVESACPYERNPQKLANKIYGGRMGNDNINDGWTYRGRGPIGITGKENYKRCGDAIGVDLISHPELLEQPHYGVLSALWFWQYKKLNQYADAGQIDKVSRGINIGDPNSRTASIGEANRHSLYNKFMSLWKTIA